MNAKKAALAIVFAFVLAVALPLRAQTGCDDSPEDPTIALALVSGAGVLAARLEPVAQISSGDGRIPLSG